MVSVLPSVNKLVVSNIVLHELKEAYKKYQYQKIS